MRSWIQVLETASCRNAGKGCVHKTKWPNPSLDPAQARTGLLFLYIHSVSKTKKDLASAATPLIGHVHWYLNLKDYLLCISCSLIQSLFLIYHHLVFGGLGMAIGYLNLKDYLFWLFGAKQFSLQGGHLALKIALLGECTFYFLNTLNGLSASKS
jgi:hypothetical protein